MNCTLIYEWENTWSAGVGATDCVAAGAGRLCTDVPTKVEVIIMGTVSITRFPLLQADLPAHVESLILCAEVRAGDGGSAVIIAVTPVWAVLIVTRTVHLGGTPIFVSSTGDVSHTIEYEGEDTGTARVPSRHGVTAVFHCSPNPGFLTEGYHGGR